MSDATLRADVTTDVETLSNNETVTTPGLNTGTASHVTLFVDDGTNIDSGGTISGAPSQYDYELQHQPHEGDSWMPYGGETGATSRAWTTPAEPNRMRAVVQNTSGGNADYRVRLVAKDLRGDE